MPPPSALARDAIAEHTTVCHCVSTIVACATLDCSQRVRGNDNKIYLAFLLSLCARRIAINFLLKPLHPALTMATLCGVGAARCMIECYGQCSCGTLHSGGRGNPCGLLFYYNNLKKRRDTRRKKRSVIKDILPLFGSSCEYLQNIALTNASTRNAPALPRPTAKPYTCSSSKSAISL